VIPEPINPQPITATLLTWSGFIKPPC
jgi:hypothetical protein